MRFSRTIIICIMLVLGAVSAWGQRYDRGYESVSSRVFVPKGSFMIGGNIRLSTHKMKDYSILVIEGIDSQGYTVSMSPSAVYMLKDNLGIGARFTCAINHIHLDAARLSIADISMSADYYRKISQNFSGIVLFKPYIPLGAGGRFAMFAEAQLGFTFGRSRNTVLVDNAIKGTYMEKYKVFLGVNPGIAAMLGNHFGMELSLGIFGLSYGWNNQIHNQVAHGTTKAASASFILNPASISVGLSYYL